MAILSLSGFCHRIVQLGDKLKLLLGNSRPLFLVEDKVFDEETIENLLKRQLREAQLIEDKSKVSQLLDTLKVLRSNPEKLTRDQCSDLIELLREQKQQLMTAMGYEQQIEIINGYFDNQEISSQKLDDLITRRISSKASAKSIQDIGTELFDEQVQLERTLKSGLDRTLSMLELKGRSTILALPSFVRNNCASEIARMGLVTSSDVQMTMLGDKVSPTLLSPYSFIDNTVPLNFLTPCQLLEAKDFFLPLFFMWPTFNKKCTLSNLFTNT